MSLKKSLAAVVLGGSALFAAGCADAEYAHPPSKSTIGDDVKIKSQFIVASAYSIRDDMEIVEYTSKNAPGQLIVVARTSQGVAITAVPVAPAPAP